MRGFIVVTLVLAGCVLDRTGQSASEIYRRELALQGARVANLETQFDDVEARVGQIEELNRARGQEEILKMETLDQVRNEVARMRGEVEVMRHEFDQVSLDGFARDEDATFRLVWLEARADQLEKSLGLKTPPAPKPAAPPVVVGDTGTPPAGTPPSDTSTPADADVGTVEVTDPDAMIKLAEENLANGREKAAEAVLTRFIEAWPDNKRVTEAMYRRAESFFNAKNYDAAVLKFQEVIDRDKKSAWAAWAMLRQGECFEAKGQKDNARLFYEDVARMWPKSPAAKEARAKLGK